MTKDMNEESQTPKSQSSMNEESYSVDQSGFSDHSPSSSPRRNLRPISPNKHNNSTVGRLSFLQSDNIDEHFRHIHESTEEILSYLQSIDVQTQQTKMDLDQLFDRSKNNNQHLSSLLDSIARYSREVTEEGSATKADVAKILQSIDQSRHSEIDEDLFRRINANQEKLLKELRSNAPDSHLQELAEMLKKNQSFLLQKLSDFETQMSGLKVQNSFGEFRSRVESLAQENSKQVNAKLAEVLQSLQSLDLKREAESTSARLEVQAAEFTERMNRSMTRFEEFVQAQTKSIDTQSFEYDSKNLKHVTHDGRTTLRENHEDLQERYRTLEKSFTNLEKKYENLEFQYDAKLRLFIELESNFVKLGEDSKQLQQAIANFDIRKYDKVREMHSGKVRDLRNITPLQKHVRVISMPPNNVPHRDSASNNSDTEEF